MYLKMLSSGPMRLRAISELRNLVDEIKGSQSGARTAETQWQRLQMDPSPAYKQVM